MFFFYLLLFAVEFLMNVLANAGETLDFSVRQMLCGKASLLNDGFFLLRTLGTANFSPELRLPIQLVYDSMKKEENGLFGYGWRCPQLESSLYATDTVLFWNTPWGEQVAIYRTHGPRGEKLEIQSPYSDWRLESGSIWEEGCLRGNWKICGSERYRGWVFEYRDGRLAIVQTDVGMELNFNYFADGAVSVSQNGRAFVILGAVDESAQTLNVNGVEHRFDYEKGMVQKTPRFPEESASTIQARLLQSIRTANLLPETFSYGDDGVLSETCRGDLVEHFVTERQSPEEYRAQLEVKREGKQYSGPVTGRLLEDGEYRYVYSNEDGRTVTLLRKDDGATATISLDLAMGYLKTVSFSGCTRISYYTMNPTSACLGMLRKVTDGKGRVLVSFRRDAKSARLLEVIDQFGNTTVFAYDVFGTLASVAQKNAGADEAKILELFRTDRRGHALEIVRLDGNGRESDFRTEISYDAHERPSKFYDGQKTCVFSYNIFGYPVSVRDAFGKETLCEYDAWNRPVKIIEANGVTTDISYNAFGAVSEVRRSHGDSLLYCQKTGYDEYGRVVSYSDQFGCVKRFERDKFGRIQREIFFDNASIGYEYDGQGRLTCVIDERGKRLFFGWDIYGLVSRTTAVGQVTTWRRNVDGHILDVVARNAAGLEERHFVNSFDTYGRLLSTDYGNNQVETLSYDVQGRLVEVSQSSASTYLHYDSLGRLVERYDAPWTTTFEYNDWGQRTRRIVTDGSIVQVEEREYDRFGRLVKISSDCGSVEFCYGDSNLLVEQRFDKGRIQFDYDELDRLVGKTLYDTAGAIVSTLRYFYDRKGRIESRLLNGRLQRYSYDLRDQLVEVRNAEGKVLEHYAYDSAGNLLLKSVGGITTSFCYDSANQLLSSTLEGNPTVHYAYDAAGRLVREGERKFTYGWGDKVLSVSDANGVCNYSYGCDGLLASVTTVDGTVSEFLWDGLALIRRNGEGYLNEPQPNGGSPILASNGTVYFNDILGTSQGMFSDDGYETVSISAFGDGADCGVFFTGKPRIDDALGYAFFFRYYRPDHGKWLTTDPMGYPDGWNSLAYCNNCVNNCIDIKGTDIYHVVDFSGCGHSALIIGNDNLGYFALDNGGIGSGGYNAGNSEQGMDHLIQHRHATLSEAFVDLSGTRQGGDAFDSIQRWRTTTSQDTAAVIAAKGSIDRGYHTVTNNCVITVREALVAANVEFNSTSLNIPIVFFNDNAYLTDNIDINSLQTGEF